MRACTTRRQPSYNRTANGNRTIEREQKQVAHGSSSTKTSVHTSVHVLHASERRSKRAELSEWHRMDRALRHARAYPHPAGCVARIETHISVVYLAGRYAYKVCKPVDFGFVDFTRADARFRCCREALRLNRRLAAPLYLGTVPIARQGRKFAIGRRGAPFDHALKMRRFDEHDVFSELLRRGALRDTDVDGVAQQLAWFHRRAPCRPPRSAFGSAGQVSVQLEAVLSSLTRAVRPTALCAVTQWCRAEMARLETHVDNRRRNGFVRECHGDLHMDNMVRWHSGAAIFDCIEFSPALRWIDVMADVAFVAMDLLARGRGDLATRFMNRWLNSTGDFAGLASLHLYVVYRALVRALVAALKPRGSGEPADSLRYIRLAERLVAPTRACMILCHGVSGSGKSVASVGLAEQIGAILISSDVERKRPARALYAAIETSLPTGAYADNARDAQYARLATLARALLDAGYPVVVDASFLRRAHRMDFVELAHVLCVPVLIVSFHADIELLVERLRARALNAHEPSDANERVLTLQLAQADPLTADEASFTVSIDTDVPLEAFQQHAFWADVQARVATRGWLAGGTEDIA